ncbi:hypothetical protein ACHAPF_003850 [Botrytis cinerea]
MRPTSILRSGGDGEVGKYGKYLGGWGNLGEFEEHFLPVLGILKSPQKSLDAHEPREMLDGGFNE